MKKSITKALIIVISIVMLFTLLINYALRIQLIHSNVEEKSADLFWQIENMIKKNEQDLAQIKSDFADDCLIRARMAAYVAQHYPEVINSREEAIGVAELLQVDEIHFFNTEGEIYAGTHPEYYHYNFNSGEQMKFFLPMLEDHSLELYQDITPNTAEQKLMQYAAVWMEDGSGIVQIGLEPQRVLKAMEGRTFSSVFSLIPTDSATVLYAIDPDSYEIVSCTAPEYIGKNAEELGLELDGHSGKLTVAHPTIDGRKNYCAIKDLDSLILARTYLESSLYKQVLTDTWLLATDIVFLSVLAIIFIYIYLDRKIVKGIIAINKKLYEIEQGGTDILFSEDAVPELAELSTHINAMLKSVLSSTKKMSIALELSRIPIGLYEYTPGSKRVVATSRVRDILMLTDEEYNYILGHPELIPQKEQQLKKNALHQSDNIYRLPGTVERYVRFEEFTYEESNLAILIDVTQEVREKRHIEQERDIESLTGLFNRRAFYAKMDEIFMNGKPLNYSALIMIDADKLKETNDLYGHRGGDLYLKKIAGVIETYHHGNAVAARLGGDEFVLCIYDCPDKGEIDSIIKDITADQDGYTVALDDHVEITVHFSMGYALYPEEGDNYHSLLELADERMYQNKKTRNGPLVR